MTNANLIKSTPRGSTYTAELEYVAVAVEIGMPGTQARMGYGSTASEAIADLSDTALTVPTTIADVLSWAHGAQWLSDGECSDFQDLDAADWEAAK